MIVDGFAGPGGWELGAHAIGLDDIVGLDIDPAACRTATAAGLLRVQADVAAYPAERFAGADGAIFSPPCPDWSQAGRRAERDGKTGWLVDLVPAWIRTIRPRWFACEQVPPALGVWRVFAHQLRALGYSTWAGLLNAADYGVPQTRTRAILLGRMDGVAHPPAPTHYDPRSEHPDGLFDTRVPWVSMAAALDLALGQVVATQAHTKISRNPDVYGLYARDVDRPSPVVLGNADRWQISTSSMTRPNDRTRSRPATEPAPTLAFGHDAAGWKWHEHVLNTGRDWKPGGSRDDAQTIGTDRPAPTVAGVGAQWQWRDRWSNGEAQDPDWPASRPATTVQGDPRIAQPGHKAERNSPDSPGRSAGAIRLQAWEAGVLQSFPADYPWQGNQGDQFRQIGDAVPPVMAAAILAALLA